jgi:cytochrome b subunit of formate dehydrogenase
MPLMEAKENSEAADISTLSLILLPTTHFILVYTLTQCVLSGFPVAYSSHVWRIVSLMSEEITKMYFFLFLFIHPFMIEACSCTWLHSGVRWPPTPVVQVTRMQRFWLLPGPTMSLLIIYFL